MLAMTEMVTDVLLDSRQPHRNADEKFLIERRRLVRQSLDHVAVVPLEARNHLPRVITPIIAVIGRHHHIVNPVRRQNDAVARVVMLTQADIFAPFAQATSKQ